MIRTSEYLRSKTLPILRWPSKGKESCSKCSHNKCKLRISLTNFSRITAAVISRQLIQQTLSWRGAHSQRLSKTTMAFRQAPPTPLSTCAKSTGKNSKGSNRVKHLCMLRRSRGCMMVNLTQLPMNLLIRIKRQKVKMKMRSLLKTKVDQLRLLGTKAQLRVPCSTMQTRSIKSMMMRMHSTSSNTK